MCVRGETITVGNFSPRELLVLLPYHLRAFFTGAATAALCAQLLSALAQSHFPLPRAKPHPFCCPSHFDFEWGLACLHKLLREKMAQKWGWQPGQRRATFNSLCHWLLAQPWTSYFTLLPVHHCLLQSTAQRYLLNVPNTLNLMLATSHFKRSCQFWLDIYP